ncbi:hypothetical protein [Maridesulfovibrio sp.]|uniref:hypothetical protein n=1 Tax=Maridesulfovibrio sp. TaxID=2795000 RepID=UPI003B00F5BD
MRPNLPAGWKIVAADPKDWPNQKYKDKLAYADGDRKTIYTRKGGWTTWPIISKLIGKHETIHSIQLTVRGVMTHSDEHVKYPAKFLDRLRFTWRNRDELSGIMSQRGTMAWSLSPLVSLLRWSWLDKDSRAVIAEYNKMLAEKQAAV